MHRAPGQRRGHLQAVQGRAPVPVGHPHQQLEGVGRQGEALAAEPPLRVLEGLADDRREVLLGQAVQGHDAAARQQRRDDFERGVFGRGADQGDQAAFDVVQEGVLLGLVEAMDFVHEEDGAATLQLLLAPGLVDHGPDLLDAREHGGELEVVRAGLAGDDARERGLAASRRPPQDHREDAVLLGRHADDRPLAHEVRLPDELGQAARPHAFGQGPAGLGLFFGVVVEDVHRGPESSIKMVKARVGPFSQGARPSGMRSILKSM